MQENENIYEILNLRKNPFEAQGEFDPDVSILTSPIKTEVLQEARKSIRMASQDKKLIVTAVIGEPGTGKTDLAKRLMRGEFFSKESKHVYVKMGIGAPSDHLFILSLIVLKLKEEFEKLDYIKTQQFLEQKKTELFASQIKIEDASDEETARAARLLNEWYNYITAIRTIGEYRSIVIYLDEVEDRWGIRGVEAYQREKDLIYLRDLFGFVQDEKEIAGNFPVALFLFMTAETYAQIGGINNALQSRLQRTINLAPFTPDEAKILFKEKMRAFRIKYLEDDFHPYTEDAIDYLIKNSLDARGFFNFRKFLINCHDCTFHFADEFRLKKKIDGIINHELIVDWFSKRKGIIGIKPSGEIAIPSDEIIDVTINRDIEAQRIWNKIKKDLLKDYRRQYQTAVRNIPHVLLFASPNNISRAPEQNTLFIKIPDFEARVLVRILDITEKEQNPNIFTLYITDSKPKDTLADNELILQLPKDKMLLYALFSYENLLPNSEKERAVMEIKEQIQTLMDKVKNYFEENKFDHYIPLIPTGSKKVTSLIEELAIISLSGEKKGIKRSDLIELDLYEAGKLKDPYWYLTMKEKGEFQNIDKIWKDIFYFNSNATPIKGAIELLTELNIIKNGKLNTLDSVKLEVSEKIRQYCEDLKKQLDSIEKNIGGKVPKKVEEKISLDIEELENIERDEILNFRPKPTSTIENHILLYNSKKKAESRYTTTLEYLTKITSIAKKVAVKNSEILSLERAFRNQRFKNREIDDSLKTIKRKIELIVQNMDENLLIQIEEDYLNFYRSANAFVRDSSDLERRISSFKFKELETAISKGHIAGDPDSLEQKWNKITSTDDYKVAEQGIIEMEKFEAKLREKAEEHLTKLNEKYRRSTSIIEQIKKVVDIKKLGEIDELGLKINSTMRASVSYWENKEYCKLLEGDFDKEYVRLVPSLKELFEMNKDYTIEDIAKKFKINHEDAQEFVRILEKLGVLKTFYRLP